MRRACREPPAYAPTRMVDAPSAKETDSTKGRVEGSSSAAFRSDTSTAPRVQSRRRSVRWLDAASAVLLASSVAGVLVVATPPILRAAGLVAAPPVRGGPAPWAQRRHAPPSFFSDDADGEDDDPMDELMSP